MGPVFGSLMFPSWTMMIMGGLVMMSMIDRGRPGEIRLVGLGNLSPVSLCWLEEPPPQRVPGQHNLPAVAPARPGVSASVECLNV